MSPLRKMLQENAIESRQHAMFDLNKTEDIRSWLYWQLQFASVKGQPAYSAYVKLQVLGRNAKEEQVKQLIAVVKEYCQNNDLIFEEDPVNDDILVIIRFFDKSEIKQLPE